MKRACLGLLAGMYALQLSSFDNVSDLAASLLVAGIFFLLAGGPVLLAWFCTGLLLFSSASQDLLRDRIPATIAGDSLVVTANVVDFPSSRGDNVTFTAAPVAGSRLPARIRLSWFQPPAAIRYGDKWRLEIRVRRPRGNRNPGGFDFESWLFRERIAAVGYVVPGRRNELLVPDRPDVVQAIRKRFVTRTQHLLADADSASVLTALAVGARHRITDEQWDRYARTGTSHLVAISGLHIGLAAGAAYMLSLALAGVLRTRRNHHTFAIACSLLVAVLYAQVSGFAVPAQRASLMLTLAGIALLRQRRPDLAAVLCAACMAIAIVNPMATMAPGFVLSFAAVALLVWIGQRQRANLPTLQLALLLGLLPLTALLFGRIAFAALPVNLVAVPLFSFVTVPLALLGLMLDGVLQALGDPVLQVAAGSVSLLDRLLRYIAASPWAAVILPGLSAAAWLSAAITLLWVALPRGWPGRAVAWVGLAALLLYVPRQPDAGCAQIDVLDVGQGLAAVVRTQEHVTMYDTGPAFRGGGNAADTVILPFLRHAGIKRISQLLVSHADLDHAGGLAAIRAAMPVRRIFAGEMLPARSVPCRAGQSWSNDGIDFRILHPPLRPDFDGNDRSCVLLIEIGPHRVLLSGDIEHAGEAWLVQQNLLSHAVAVVVPHHGSRTSSGSAFVNALRPSVAIVSAGFGNQWGFPKADIVDRWQQAGAHVLNTATSGMIALRVCEHSGLESIRQYRVENRRIWHE